MISSGLTAHLIWAPTTFRSSSQHFAVKLWLPQMLPNFGYGRQIMPTDVKKQGLSQMSANRPNIGSTGQYSQKFVNFPKVRQCSQKFVNFPKSSSMFVIDSKSSPILTNFFMGFCIYWRTFGKIDELLGKLTNFWENWRTDERFRNWRARKDIDELWGRLTNIDELLLDIDELLGQLTNLLDSQTNLMDC